MADNLKKSIEDFVKSNYREKTFALFYAPNRCFLALVDKNGNVEVKDNTNKFDLEKVFEARIFNETAELRWLKGFGEKIISDEIFTSDENFVKKLDQFYLVWGKKNDSPKDNWTQFATARIGAFHVPKSINADYAQFTAVEYLMSEGENGNVFVADERLKGIEAYQPEGVKKNAD